MNTGKKQTFHDLPADRFLRIVEDSATPAVVELKPAKLGSRERELAR